MTAAGTYRADIASLRRHPLPDWYAAARLGIMVHWGPYSIPAFAPRHADLPAGAQTGTRNGFRYNRYAEWYQNSLRFEDSPTACFHRDTFGDRYPYRAFGQSFNEQLDQWDPESWAEAFARSGADYVVLVAKHHDGFTLWPSDICHPTISHWGTRRDIVGELAEAVRARGLRFGLYYSGGLDWSFRHPRIESMAGLLLAVPRAGSGYLRYANAHYAELISRYRPDYLWNDICYPSERAALQLAASYYNAMPDGIINDRWISLRGLLRPSAWRMPAGYKGLLSPAPPVWDVRTPEYAAFKTRLPFPWESTRGIGQSFGYNRQEQEGDYLDGAQVAELLAGINDLGGKLLLNVGPTGAGHIPPGQARCLQELGQLTKPLG